MYANKLAVAVKHRGKALQEFGETIYLPFGSEYSLLIKNLNTVRAIVKVKIDGVDVTQGVNLVVQPNSSIELERFIKNGNLNAGNRFKFLQRTGTVELHRGVRLEDGLVQVTWSFEKPVQQWVGLANAYLPNQPVFNGNAVGGAASGALYNSVGTPVQYSPTSTTITTSSPAPAPKGITGPGAVSHQQFAAVGWFPTESASHVMVLQLAGEAQAVGAVSNAVYTRTKIDCTVCGSKAKTSAKFCSDCGASLNIIG